MSKYANRPYPKPRPGDCRKCDAMGGWKPYTDISMYCFHSAYFLKKAAPPVICVEAVKDCPLLNITKTEKGNSMSEIIIQLTAAEMLQAGVVGLMRQTQNIKNGLKPSYGSTPGNEWQMHIEGALGEYAVAKYMNIFWSGNVGNMVGADVGPYEVRTAVKIKESDVTRKRLILHKPEEKYFKSDSPDSKFVHVVGLNGTYFIRGWIYGHEGQKDEYWSDPQGTGRHAYFVDNKILRPIDTLKIDD